MDLRAIAAARIVAGRPLPLVGMLLADRTRMGEVVPLDPNTGGELADNVDERPAFVVATDGDATDGHILRQIWDFNRVRSGIAHILINHDKNRDAGLWQMDDRPVRAASEFGSLLDGSAIGVKPREVTVLRAWFDTDDEIGRWAKGKVKRGMLKGTSTGWDPGEIVRRGELPESDPFWREAVDGPCGPEEGLVMGSERKPNTFLEASLTPVPADPRAIAVERLHKGGGEDLARAMRGENFDADRLLAFLANEPRARAFLQSLVTRSVRDELARLTASNQPPADVRTVGDLFRTKGA